MHLQDAPRTPRSLDLPDALLRAVIGLAFVLASAAAWWPGTAEAARLKEIAAVQGVRTNQLVGYGLVVGLDGTGDQTTQTPFTTQSLNAMLQQLGVTVPAGTSVQLRNVAAVLVTATIPPFMRSGARLDVTVSSIGNARSISSAPLPRRCRCDSARSSSCAISKAELRSKRREFWL